LNASYISTFVDNSGLLVVGTAIALVWCNLDSDGYYGFARSIQFLVNDIGMVFFFALITKEIVEATIPGGVLHPWRRTMMPVIASVGAAAVPAQLHMRLVDALDEPMLAIGWPVSETGWPRTRPSLVSMATVRTVDSPRCWATSSTRR
jgi:NhaA family Na+:H+ antiporter